MSNNSLSFHWLLGTTAVFFILSGFIDGLTYWLFGSMGILPLVYLPKMAMLVCLTLQFFIYLEHNLPKQHFIIASIFLFFCFVGILNQEHTERVLVGLNPYIPFLFGIIAYKGIFPKLENNFAKLSIAVFFLITFGAFLDIFTNVPWKGFSSSIGSISVEGSREWETGGIDRISGFARINGRFAIQILTCCLVYHIYGNSKFLKFFIWLLSFILIILSTSKTALIVIVFFLCAFFANYFVTKRKKEKFMKSLPCIACFIGISLLLISYLVDFEEVFGINRGLMSFLISSFFARIMITWPPIINHVVEQNFIFGTGIGSLSASLISFPGYSIGDSGYLWLFSTMGLLSLPLLFYWLKNIHKLNILENKRDKFFLFFTIVFLVYGITIDALDNPMLFFIIGLSVSHFRYRKRGLSKNILNYGMGGRNA